MNINAEAAKRYTDTYGIHIVPVPPGTKGPRTKGWGNNLFADGDAAAEYYIKNPNWNLGVILGPSGMGSLDIDDLESFELIIAAFGLEEEFEELKRFPTIQGNPETGYRIMFRIPDGREFGRNSVGWPLRDEPTRSNVVFELRAACKGAQLQDVLPPSIHPETKRPYTWLVEPPATRDEWPFLPAWLDAIWQGWKSFEPQFKNACPWAEKKAAPVPVQQAEHRQQGSGGSVIEAYIDAHNLEAELARYGYTRKGDGRWMYPGSSTKTGGVVLDVCGRRAFNHHGSDPLGAVGGRPMNAFDLYCYYEHRNDVRAAVKQIAEDMGLESKPKRERERKLTVKRDTLSETSSDEPQQRESAPVASGVEPLPKNAPFRLLGYNGERNYYLPHASEQVYSLSASAHTNAGAMLKLAPLGWWLRNFPKDPDNENKGVDWTRAASVLMSNSHVAGVHSESDLRGRGAWYDDGRSVVHAGDCLLVDGERVAIKDFQTRHIYEKGKILDRYVGTPPAEARDSQKVFEALTLVSWSKPIHATFAAGWVALAAVCGSLAWRPHLWVTGERGTGKSWVQTRVISQLLGDLAINTQGATSEAGIRQLASQDARPVLMDEAESERDGTKESIKAIIELARMSSFEAGAEIIKGTSGGRAMTYRCRSVFMMGSINVPLSMAADTSRFTVVSIEKSPGTAEANARWERLQEIERTLFQDPMYCASVRSRIYRLIPVIRQNAAILASVIRDRVGDQRTGDQYGALIAGAMALSSDDVITVEQASRYIDAMNLSDAEDTESVSDQQALLAEIMQYMVRYDSDSGHQITRSIREIMQTAAGVGAPDTGLQRKGAKELLARHGIVVHRDGSASFANAHRGMRVILKDSPWSAGHKTVLKRLDGAEEKANPINVGASKARVVHVPLASLGLEDTGENE